MRRVFQEAIQTPEGRDALVQRCCASVAPEDRQGFIDELQRVAGPLSQDSLSRCLHAFHLMHPLVRSNAQKRAVRRGPRPRRRKVLEEAAAARAVVATGDAGVDAGLTHDADATGPPATGGDGAQGLAEWSTARPLAGWGTLPLATGGLALNLRTGGLEACRAAGADDNLNAPEEATTGQRSQTPEHKADAGRSVPTCRGAPESADVRERWSVTDEAGLAGQRPHLGPGVEAHPAAL